MLRPNSTPVPKAAVMGWPVAHSLSPRLHGFWLQKHGIPGTYEAIGIEPQNLEAALRTLPGQGFRGVNLTVPLKEIALNIVDDLDAAAQRIGAVNLVIVGADGKLEGRNTDAYGFAQNLLAANVLPGGKALVLGAGGAARAVLAALTDMGFDDVVVTNRTPERAQKLARDFSVPAIDWADAAAAMVDVSLLVNATSLGMKGQPPLEITLDALPQSATVTDIVYVPLETGLLRAARQRGLKTVDGLGMLLHQARPAFAAFFGGDPEVTEELRHFILEGKKDT
ncbi:MAG: shikimate dehydrogenase [Alphaproteobacteria bacterium]|nr:shikimate dehydrogenase [Alphaproteobacteria bacterium]